MTEPLKIIIKLDKENQAEYDANKINEAIQSQTNTNEETSNKIVSESEDVIKKMNTNEISYDLLKEIVKSKIKDNNIDIRRDLIIDIFNITPKIKNVTNRKGQEIQFDKTKIRNSIQKALDATETARPMLADRLTNLVIADINKKVSEDKPSIEIIQDTIEQILISEGFTKTAKAYILYRKQREQMRNIDTMFDSKELIDSYLNQIDWRVNENSNMAFSLQGLNNYIFSAVTSTYWLNKIYPPEIQAAHKNAEIHIHDLGLLASYCAGWDLKDIIMTGFRGARDKIVCRPPKHFRAALGQLVNFLYSLQGEVAGAVAVSNLDTLMAPFIRYDGLDYKKTKQALQEFIYNMNVPTRVGFQTPFSNVTLDLVCPSTLADQPVIIGGEPQKETYKEFKKEMEMFNRAFAEIMLEGDGLGKVFTFPIPTYNISKDFDWDNPAYEKIWEMTAKYGIPYFANYVNADLSAEDATSMCCRLRLDRREIQKRGGGLFASTPLTGSIGVVTINLARIGYEAKDKQEFLDLVKKRMDHAKNSLIIKNKMIEKFTEGGLYPYAKFYLRTVKQRSDKYWGNHFNTIGIHGMNEALINLIGKDITSPEGHAFTLEIMNYMLEVIKDYQEETDMLFNLEATPAEGTSFRFAKKDKEMYPEITVANEARVNKDNAAPYYTNSTQLPVNFSSDLFEVLDLQNEIQAKYTGGTVLHCFLGEKLPSIESTKTLVKKIVHNYKIPYVSITPTFSICPRHGYLAGEHEYCPLCDKDIGYIEKDNIDGGMEDGETKMSSI